MQFKFPMTVTNGKGIKRQVPAGTEFVYETFDLGDTVLHSWSTVIDGEAFSHDCRARPVATRISENWKNWLDTSRPLN